MGTTTILKFTYQDELEARLQRNLYESAVRDGLTGLFNRRYFDERLRTDMAFAVRHHTVVADIDSFKGINDRFGHQGGDHVLRELSQRLQSLVRTEDLMARYGGEEFAIVCPATTQPQATVLAERLRQAAAEGPFLVGGVPVRVTISLGIAIAPSEQIPYEAALVRAADVALYEAKRAGLNRSVAFSEFGSAL